MSYLYQNYFNNFQIRNPVLKNPVNHNIPLQLTKVRPADLVNSDDTRVSVEQLNCASLRVSPITGTETFVIPPAHEIITWLGVQSNGLPTPTYYNSVQQGDVLIIPVLNVGTTGCTLYAGTGSTGALTLNTPESESGNINQLVIDFNNVTSNSNGVTGSYTLYGCACPAAL